MKKPQVVFFLATLFLTFFPFTSSISFSLWTEKVFFFFSVLQITNSLLCMNGVGYLHILPVYLRKPVSTYIYVCSLLKESHRHQSFVSGSYYSLESPTYRMYARGSGLRNSRRRLYYLMNVTICLVPSRFQLS